MEQLLDLFRTTLEKGHRYVLCVECPSNSTLRQTNIQIPSRFIVTSVAAMFILAAAAWSFTEDMDWDAKQDQCKTDQDCGDGLRCTGVLVLYKGHRPGYGTERTRMRCVADKGGQE